MTVHERINALRKAMTIEKIDAFIIPSGDPHQSEYVASHFKDREWISGFTGSAGTAVVFHDHAGMWTDSRYFLQAEKEFSDNEFVLHKITDRAKPGMIEFICEKLPAKSIVGCNGNVFALSEIKEIKHKLAKSGISLVTDKDLISDLWTNRPPLPKNKISDHSVDYAGISRDEKMKSIRKIMKEKGAKE